MYMNKDLPNIVEKRENLLKKSKKFNKIDNNWEFMYKFVKPNEILK